jgi:hypothetical protein
MIRPLIKKHTKKINMFIRMIDTNREIDQILVSEYNIYTKKTTETFDIIEDSSSQIFTSLHLLCVIW